MKAIISYSKWIMCTIIGLLIAIGTNNALATYLAAALSAVCIVLYNKQDSLSMLLFLMSFAHAFKSSPSSTSFFVILMMLYILWHMIICRSQHKVIGWIMCLAAYVTVSHIANGMMELSQLIKFAMNLLFLYIAVQQVNYRHPRDIFMIYIYGVLLASILKYSGIFPNISLYTDNNADVYRFTGLHEDPNYYGVNVIISLCLVVVMYHKRDISPWLSLTLVGLLVWFAALTVSKMVFLMLLLPALSFFYSNYVEHRCRMQLLSVGLLAILIGGVFSGEIDMFNSVLNRFGEANDASTLTTGRTVEWKIYINYILESPIVLLFGRGLNALSPMATSDVPHNTYIDFIYNLGILGTVGWICCLRQIFAISELHNKKNAINTIVFISVLIMWLALSELLYFDMPFHILLAYIVWNTPMDSKEKRRNLSEKNINSRNPKHLAFRHD